MAPKRLPVDSPYRSVEDVVAGLRELEAAFARRADRRGVFISAYLPITLEIQSRLRQRQFADNEWVARYLVAFADLYRSAVAADQDGREVPKPWRIAFDAAAADECLLLQHLLLGINAHINHDLPVALAEVTIDPDREGRYRDHTGVNEALRLATDPVQNRLARLYAPGLAALDWMAGPFDEEITNFSFGKARDASWRFGVSLVDAAGDPERVAMRDQIGESAAVLARLLLAPTLEAPLLFRILRQLERQQQLTRADGDDEVSIQWGPFGSLFQLVVDREGLVAKQLAATVAGLRLPSTLMPRMQFEVATHSGDVFVDARILLPLVGSFAVGQAVVSGLPAGTVTPPRRSGGERRKRRRR